MSLIILFVLTGLSYAYAQDSGKRRITGTVTDRDGSPLPGAYVFIKGTEVGTTTNIDGMYVIDINPKDQLTLALSAFWRRPLHRRPAATRSMWNCQRTLL